jgi:Zn ribbon nucleic-acid-binding protein
MINNKKTHEQFSKEIFAIFGNEYKIVGKYKDTNTNITMEHNVCGKVFLANPNRMINRGQGCPVCGRAKSAKSRTKKANDFKHDVLLTLGENYEVLGEYVNNKKKILMKHNVCRYKYEAMPVNILKGNKCPRCAGLVKKTTHEFREEVKVLTGEEYTVLGEYKNADSKIKMSHNLCDFKYKVTPSWFLRGARCPRCSMKMKKDTDTFKSEVFKLTKGNYEVVGEYESSHKKALMKHMECNKEYYVSPTRFLSGDRCPFCKESKAEKIIEKILLNNNIPFKQQHYFKDLKHKSYLTFDFFIEEKNLAIEYDGEFHYLPIYGKERLNSQKMKDKLKDNYCKNKNINLVRIPYWDFDKLEKIITDVIRR